MAEKYKILWETNMCAINIWSTFLLLWSQMESWHRPLSNTSATVNILFGACRVTNLYSGHYVCSEQFDIDIFTLCYILAACTYTILKGKGFEIDLNSGITIHSTRMVVWMDWC